MSDCLQEMSQENEEIRLATAPVSTGSPPGFEQQMDVIGKLFPPVVFYYLFLGAPRIRVSGRQRRPTARYGKPLRFFPCLIYNNFDMGGQ